MQEQFDIFEEDPIFESMVFVARNKGLEIYYGLGPGHQLIQEQGQSSLIENDGATHRKKIRALESIMKFLGRNNTKQTPSAFSLRKHRNDFLDCDGSLALHHIVLSICKERISIGKGLTNIDMLIAKHPTAIHQFDKRHKSPLDIVYDNLLPVNNPDQRSEEGSDEENVRDLVLQTLHTKLKKVRIDPPAEVYMGDTSICT